MKHTPKIVCHPFILTISNWPQKCSLSLWCSSLPIDRHQPVPHTSFNGKVIWSHSHGFELTNRWIESQHLACLPSTASRSTTFKYSTILLDHSLLQMHLQTRSITDSECISEFARSLPPSASQNSLYHGLGVYLWVCPTFSSNCIFKLAWSWPQSEVLSSLDLCLQVHLERRSNTASQSISKLVRSRPPSASLNSLNLGLQLHLHTRSIMASKCISEFTWPRPRSASANSLDHGLPVYLSVHSISNSNCITKLAWSRPQSVSLSSLDHYFQAHLELLPSTTCSQFRYTMCRWVAI